MNPDIESLSNKKLDPENGPLSKKFFSLGCSDFHEVCNWLHALPYGTNSAKGDLLILFEDNCGTCTTKHGIAATLAVELELPMVKYLAFYKVDESIRKGSRAVLTPSGIDYVPAIHCVLGEGIRFVDLTWGNQTGKEKDLREFELFVKVPPLPTPEEYDAIYDSGIEHYKRLDSRLAKLDNMKIKELARECVKASQAIDCVC